MKKLQTILMTLMLLIPISAKAGMNVEYFDGDRLHTIARNVDHEFVSLMKDYGKTIADAQVLHSTVFGSMIRMERRNGKHVFLYREHQMNVWKDDRSWVAITINGKPIFKVDYTGHAKYLVKCPNKRVVQVDELQFVQPTKGTWVEGLSRANKNLFDARLYQTHPEFFTGDVCTNNAQKNYR